MGYLKIAWMDVLRVVGGSLTGNTALTAGLDELTRVVVMEVRLPRILTAARGGWRSGLVRGRFPGHPAQPPGRSVYAGGFRRCRLWCRPGPVAEPDTWSGIYSVPVCAFIGATATLMLVVYLSSSAGGANANNLILSGIIVAAILSAGISFLKFVADEQVSVIIFWLMGSFASKTWADVGLTSAFLLVGLSVFIFYARDLNLLVPGATGGRIAGCGCPSDSLDIAHYRLAGGGSLRGRIGHYRFCGLLVPHMMRALVGPDNRRLLPLSLFSGAILLLCADTVTRAVLPHEIPIGVLDGADRRALFLLSVPQTPDRWKRVLIMGFEPSAESVSPIRARTIFDGLDLDLRPAGLPASSAPTAAARPRCWT
jgi:iron complex transport system permease protein